MCEEMTLKGALLIVGALLILTAIGFFKGWTGYELVKEDEDDDKRRG